MFNPYILVALVLAFLAWGGINFGTGWHYGDKGKIAITKYEKLEKDKAEVDAKIKEANEQHDRDAKALAANSHDAEGKLAAKGKELDDERQHTADLAHRAMVLAANLATDRLVLGDVTADRDRAIGAALAATNQATAQPADIAGRLAACQSAHGALLTSSAINNAELKLAISLRDACVERYEVVQHKLNGD